MTARQIAFAVLRRVEEGGAYASRALDAALASAGALEPREAGLATELVYGTLRRALALDAALEPHLSRPLAQVDAPARVALRMGAYELLYLGTAPHAAVSQAVDLARAADHGRASGFVNAVLRALSRAAPIAPPPLEADPAGHVAAVEALPRWLAEEWVAFLGASEALALAAAMNRPAPLCLRSPRRDALLERLRAAGIGATPAVRAPSALLVAGASVGAVARAAGGLPFQVQDEAAQLVSLLAAGHLAGRRARVLDACAAPGGKATHIAELMENKGEIVALELDEKRIARIRENCDRLGITIVRSVTGDASLYRDDVFDRVLIDAPCSGLGVLRRHPDGRWTKTGDSIRERAKLQAKILANCAALVKPGGVLVYATCTTEPEENEEIVNNFLAKHPAFALDDPLPLLPPSTSKLVSADRFFRTFPDEPSMDGFFAARIIRKN